MYGHNCTVLVRESVVSRYEGRESRVVRVIVHVLVRESEPVLARTKRDWNVRGATSKGLLYIFFVSRGVKCVVKLVHFICF